MVNILVVEDDKASAIILEKLIQKLGYRLVAIAEKGEEALNIIKEKPIDLILMDIALPGSIDGIETAKKIKKAKNIPIIYITAGEDQATFERAKESMPMDYIVKPFNSDSLRRSVEMAIYKASMEKKIRASELKKIKILEALPDIIFEIHRDGNPISEDDKKIASSLWNEDLLKKAYPHIQQAFSSKKMTAFQWNKASEDNIQYFESRIVPLESDKALVITRDITDSKIHELQLNDEKNKLEGLIEERTKELKNLNKSLIYEIDKRAMIQEEIKLFVDVVEQSPRCVAIFEKNGILKYINKAFTDLTGYTKADLTGLFIAKVPNPVLTDDSILKELRGVKSWSGEICNRKKNGEIYYLSINISKIKNENGKTTYIVVNGEDITERKKDEQEFEKMKSLLKKSASDAIDKEMDWQTWKEKMLSRNISRTDKSIFSNINNSFTQGAGFGTLITFMEMMDKNSELNDGKRIVDNEIFLEAMKNVRIVQNAFKIFAGIDWVISNTFDLELFTVKNFHKLLKSAIKRNQQYLAINKNRIIINEIPRGLENKKVRINPQYFEEAISELIINALKFSKSSSTIIVMLYSQQASLRISVLNEPVKTSDGIIGIPPEYDRVIFEPFYRISKLVYERYNTLDFGIGLTFVEKIVARHGGEIYAENILDYSDINKDPVIKVNMMISLPMAREE